MARFRKFLCIASFAAAAFMLVFGGLLMNKAPGEGSPTLIAGAIVLVASAIASRQP